MRDSTRPRTMRTMEVYKILLATCFFFVIQELETFRDAARYLSINLGGGKCKFTPPSYTANESATYFKTLIAGYPGGSKRIVYNQFEGLTGLTVNDEWPNGTVKPNFPFMKANYPHHEGWWTWGDDMDQVVLVMRNPRHAIIEYHDVLNDIAYANTAEAAYSLSDNLYQNRAPVEQYMEWRNDRTLNEIHWYGWFIDYWMEGGLMRDIPSHNLTTLAHFRRQGQPGPYTESGRAYEVMVGNMTVEPTIDPHCVNELNCEPVAIISVEHILDHQLGANESAKIGATLDDNEGITIIEHEARECVWRELVVNFKGVRNMLDRGGPPLSSYTFTDEMYQAMLDQLDRLKTKYSAPEWSVKPIVQDLLLILDEYIVDITYARVTNTEV